MRTCIVVSLALVLSLVAGCIDPASSKPAGQVIGSEALAAAGLQYYWQLDVQLDRGESVQSLYALDETLYILTDRNRVVALDALTGLEKWRRIIAGPEEKVFAPYHYDGLRLTPEPLNAIEVTEGYDTFRDVEFDAVFWNSYRHVLVIDRNSGQLYRDIPFRFTASTAGSASDRSFYVGSSEGLVNALRLRSGVFAWGAPMRTSISAPVETEEMLIFAADDSGQLTAWAPGRLEKPVWSTNLNGAVVAEFHADDRGLFVGTEQNFIYALRLSLGEELWTPVITEGAIRQGLQVGDNTIFAYADRDAMYALNIANGQTRWKNPDARQVLSIMSGQVYLLSTDGKLLRVNEVLGEGDLALPLPGMRHFAPNIELPAIFASTNDGRVFCIRPLEAGRLTPADLPRLPGRVR